ncbi:MAG: cytochrome c maturation protein CcmE [Sneathiellaceae bacterium]
MTDRAPGYGRRPAGLGSRKRRRLWMVLGGMALLGVAVALILSAFDDNLVFFHSPTDIAGKQVPPDRRIRIGGLVEAGSVSRDGMVTEFTVTDTVSTLRVRYSGLLPDLFREGQGIVAEGALGRDGLFTASQVLAKHDENYMPPEVADSLKRAGVWQHGPSGVPSDGVPTGGVPAANPAGGS